MYYHITFVKEFGSLAPIIRGDYEFKIYCTTDKKFALEKAKLMNQKCLININVEHFKVWETVKKTYNKKTSKLIYPSTEYPLFN